MLEEPHNAAPAHLTRPIQQPLLVLLVLVLARQHENAEARNKKPNCSAEVTTQAEVN